FANLRTLYTYMWTHPGGRLLFMGNEIGQTSEWNYQSEIPWHLLQFAPHRGLQRCVRDLNRILKAAPALYGRQFKPEGFEWIDLNHRAESVLVYRRKGPEPADDLLVILNLTPVVRWDWQLTVHGKDKWRELFNSDRSFYGGTGEVYNPVIRCQAAGDTEHAYQLTLNLPPLGAIILK
ncbi:MAG: glycogen branching protein, partial [Flaviaesturariibacter sp.]|nr:glycogen branching protein [Flaviaesturariibacter sp.]